MKPGQLYIVTSNKARAIIKEVGNHTVKLRWISETDGSPIPEGHYKASLYEMGDIEEGVSRGQVIICDPTDDPNMMFLMRKQQCT